MTVEERLQKLFNLNAVTKALFQYMKNRQRVATSSQLNTIWHTIRHSPGIRPEADADRDKLVRAFEVLEELGFGVASRSPRGRIIAFRWDIQPPEIAALVGAPTAAINSQAAVSTSATPGERRETSGRRSSDVPIDAERVYFVVLGDGKQATLALPKAISAADKEAMLRTISNIPATKEVE